MYKTADIMVLFMYLNQKFWAGLTLISLALGEFTPAHSNEGFLLW